MNTMHSEVSFVEDRLENAEALAAAGTHVILLNRPWNQAKHVEGATRVSSWDEIPPLVEQLAR